MSTTGCRTPIGTRCLSLGLLVALLGCNFQNKPATVEPPYLLQETWKTTSIPLREELAQLQQAGELPENRVQALATSLQGGTSFIAELKTLYERKSHTNLLEWSAEQLKSDRKAWSSRQRESFLVLRERHLSEREQLRTLLAQNRPLGFAAHEAAVHDFAFLQDFQISHALLHVDLMESYVAQQPEAGLAALQAMFQLSSKLSEQGSATTRLQAAHLRRTTFAILSQWLALDARHAAQLAPLTALLQSVRNELPSEAEVWRGERQLGLEYYERVRRGQLASLLPSEWHQQLQKSNRLLVTLKQTHVNLDQDEQFYLTTVRSLEAAAQQPYFERQEILKQIRASMEQATSSPEIPFVAINLLLEDFEQVALSLAQDKALCEAWHLALVTSVANQPPSSMPLNPVTGQPYELQREGMVWSIRGLTTSHGEATIRIAARP
jgi:hypothetical protein